MNPIIEAMKAYSAGRNVAIAGGAARQMAMQKLEFPLIWHEPVVLTGKSGMQEGTLTYKIKFHWLEKNGNHSAEALEAIREKIEKRVLDLVGTIENHSRVRSVRLISCTPAESELTHYGEIALSAQIEAEVMFCNNPYS